MLLTNEQVDKPASIPHEQEEPILTLGPTWKLNVDGASNLRGNGGRIILTSLKGTKVEYALRFQFKATNSEADYEGLLAGMRLNHDLGAKQLSMLNDSMLIINQTNNTYQVKGKAMRAYMVKAQLQAPFFL